MSDDDGNEICCPKCQQWPCACRAKSLPCPFCQMNLTSVALDMRYASDVAWQHPPTGCLLDGLNVFGRELPKWNRRTPASAVLPEARSADTPTSLPAPDAGWRDALEEAAKLAELFLSLAKEHGMDPDTFGALVANGTLPEQIRALKSPLPAPPVGDGR